MKSRPPLHGYNTNYRRDGLVYHVQTEDLGSPASAVVTQVFTGGTVLAVRRTPYVEILDDDTAEDRVRELMRKQHKALLIALRDGTLDDTQPTTGEATQAPKPVAGPVTELSESDFDIIDEGPGLRDTVRMDRPPNFAQKLVDGAKAASKDLKTDSKKAEPKKTQPLFSTENQTGSPPPVPLAAKRRKRQDSGRYGAVDERAPERARSSPRIFSEISQPQPGFGEELGERSLDEVILAYLAEDLQEE